MAIDRGSLGFSSSEAEDEDEEEEDDDDDEGSDMGIEEYPISSPLIGEVKRSREGMRRERQVSILAIVAAALRRSLVVCSVEHEEVEGEEDDVAFSSEVEIGLPTDVRHIAHVTFDRINGFLGLPEELEPEVPRKAPSASAKVFGVSANSMQCAYDKRGNSVPTILLLMQGHLYSHGGLQTEGIFRINGENGHELYVREQLNRGIVPQGVDLHCLAGLIKAWFRELPSGVLDSLTQDQIMHCNTEEECSQLACLLPPTEAALLDWAINLMTDVVQCECQNKMNARSISMVFAPNMTQMADPLTALIYAVQVMNFLRMLVLKTLTERNESTTHLLPLELCSEYLTESGESNLLDDIEQLHGGRTDGSSGSFSFNQSRLGNFMLPHQEELHSDLGEESFNSFESKADREQGHQSAASGNSSPVVPANKYNHGNQGLVDMLTQRRRARKLCWHRVFRLGKPVRKSSDLKTREERTVS